MGGGGRWLGKPFNKHIWPRPAKHPHRLQSPFEGAFTQLQTNMALLVLLTGSKAFVINPQGRAKNQPCKKADLEMCISLSRYSYIRIISSNKTIKWIVNLVHTWLIFPTPSHIIYIFAFKTVCMCSIKVLHF